jgi:hypothetical protein
VIRAAGHSHYIIRHGVSQVRVDELLSELALRLEMLQSPEDLLPRRTGEPGQVPVITIARAVLEIVLQVGPFSGLFIHCAFIYLLLQLDTPRIDISYRAVAVSGRTERENVSVSC